RSPTDLSPLNGFEWSGTEPERRLARVLLEELGIEDKDRRVFLSNRRSDGLGAAEQLHDALSHFRFQPFIDRFGIRPGDDVQSRIADSLEQHAFLLILETSEAHLSDWVYDEVDYALSHTMGTLNPSMARRPDADPGKCRHSPPPTRSRRSDHGLARLRRSYVRLSLPRPRSGRSSPRQRPRPT